MRTRYVGHYVQDLTKGVNADRAFCFIGSHKAYLRRCRHRNEIKCIFFIVSFGRIRCGFVTRFHCIAPC